MSEDVDHLLWRRMTILTLDVETIGREFPEVFGRVKRNCPLCEDRVLNTLFALKPAYNG